MRKIILTLVFALFAFYGFAQTRYWISTVSSNWNNTANWSTTAGGAGGASVPGSTDLVVFSGTGGRNGNCLLDVTPAVMGITINGYSGTLDLNGRDFTTTGTNIFTSGTVANTGVTASLIINTATATTFNGGAISVPVSGSSGDISFNGSVFGSTVTLTKTGSGTNNNTGGNTFHGALTITNNGTGELNLAVTNPDTFNASVTLNNTSSSRIQIGVNSVGNVFAAGLTINHGGNTSNLNTIIARNAASTATINGNLILNCTNSSATSGIIIANDGGVTVNGNIVVSSSSGRGILLGGDVANSGNVTLAGGFDISSPPGTFTTGLLSLIRFTQTGGTSQNFVLSGVADLVIGPSSQFGGSVNFSSPQLHLNGATYSGPATLEKSGATDNASAGNNIFNNTAVINNSGSGEIFMGNGAADTFNGTATFNNTGSYRIRIAHNHAGQTTVFASDLTLNTNKTGGTDTWSFLVAENPNTNISIAGNLTINCDGTLESDHRFLNGVGSIGTFSGDVTVNLTNTHASTSIAMGVNGTSTYNSNIVVSNTGPGGINFNTVAATSTLTSGTISIGPAGFSDGALSMVRFTQIGPTPQTLNIPTGTAQLILGPASSFGGDVEFRAPQISLNGTTFTSVVNIEKTGAGNNYGAGGNVFNGATTITNSGSGYLLSGGTNADAFNGITTFNNSGSHRIYLAHNHTGQTTTFATDVIFNSNKSGGSEQYAFQVGENANSNISFGGTTTINCDGAIPSDNRFAYGTGATATYNGPVVINVTNTFASTLVTMGGNGTSIYQGNIQVSNTGGATGIYFNSGTGSSTLSSPATISIAPGGFSTGTLYLRRFAQTGLTNQTLTAFTGASRLIVGPSSLFDGDVDFRAPQLYLHGATYNGIGNFEKNGATDNNGAGGNTFNGTTTITNSGTGYLLTGNVNADAFVGPVTFNNTGSYRIFLAHNHTNQTTTFASTATFHSNKSGGTDTWSFFMCEGANTHVSFAGDLNFNIDGALESSTRILSGAGSTFSVAGTSTFAFTNTHPSTLIYMGYNGISNFNGNIVVSNTGGASGLYFSVGTAATTTLAASRTITIDPVGFSGGTLYLARFTQVGNTAQTLNSFSGTTRLMVGPLSAFGGDVDFKAPQVYLHGCTYSGVATIEKTGAGDNYGNGGNTFMGVTTLTTSGSGYFLTGGVNADTFNDVATFNNNGSYRLYFAYNHPGQTTTFASDVFLNSNRTGGADQWSYLVTEAAGSKIAFGGNLTINCMGAVRSDYRFLNGAGTTQTYGGDVAINVTNTNPSTTIYMGNTGVSTYSGDIQVSNTGGSNGIYFNYGSSSSSTLALGHTIKIVGGFNGGTLSLPRFTQLGTTPQTLKTFTGTSRLIVGPASVFNGGVDFGAPQLYLNGAVYNAAATLEKTGATDNYSDGGNQFNDVTVITNNGSGEIFLGNVSSDEFNGLTTFNNTGIYRIRIAYNHANQTTTFASNVIMNSNKSGGVDPWSFLVCDGVNTAVQFGGDLALNVSGSLRSDHRFLNGVGSHATFNGNVIINNSNAGTVMSMGVNGLSNYNGNIVVANTAGASGIYFNTSASATSTLASGKTISIGAGGFSTGTISLIRFTQVGATPQTLNSFSGNASLIVGPSSNFAGAVTFVAPQLYLNGATYGGNVYAEKNGSTTNNDSNGGNTFNGTTNIVNTSGARLRMASTSGDNFVGSTTFTKSSTGAFEPAYNLTSTFSGDLSTNTNTVVTFGTGTGIVQFVGGTAQSVNKTASTSSPIFQRMSMAKSGSAILTLNNDITIGSTAVFTNGILLTTGTNYLNFADNATASGANDLSYVIGPVRKTGNDAFTYPVGGGNFYRPISISAPASTSDHFTGQYFHSAQVFGGDNTFDPSFYTVSGCEYWILDRTNGVSNVNVTLSWNESACGGPGYVTLPSDLRVTRWNGTAWVNHGNGGTTGTSSSGTVVTSAVVTSFSPFTIASVTSASPLPVELERFWATDTDNGVIVKWTTVTEINSHHFELRRSSNGFDFEKIYSVKAAGSSNERLQYSFTDDGPYSGLSYYKLVQVDDDGKFHTWICSVTHGNSPEFEVFPNPAGNEMIKLSQKTSVIILNSMGQTISTYPEPITTLDASSLSPGVYLIRNPKGQTLKFIKK